MVGFHNGGHEDYYFPRLEESLFVSCKEKFRAKTFLQKSFVNFKFHLKVFLFVAEDDQSYRCI